MEDILFTVAETAKLLKTNPNYVYQLIKKGFLKPIKIGCIKIRKSTLIKFIDENEGMDLTDLNNIKQLKMEGGDLNYEKEIR